MRASPLPIRFAALLLLLLVFAAPAHARSAKADRQATVPDDQDAEWAPRQEAEEQVDGAGGMPWSPADGAAVQQSPPDLTWPWVAGAVRYLVELKGPDGQWRKATTKRNSLSWPEPLPPGDYEWKVSPAGGTATRRFTVTRDALPFVVPPEAELLMRTSQAKHPRFQIRRPAGPPPTELSALSDRVFKGLGRPIEEVSEFDEASRVVDRAQFKKEQRKAKRDGQRAAQQLVEVGLAWQLTGDARFAAEAHKRLLQVASWDPQGTSGIGGVHSVARDLVWGMAFLYDLLYANLSPSEREQVRGSILARAEGIKHEFLDDARMERQPRNSHGWTAWGAAAAAVTLVAGDDKKADSLFLELVPGFITSIAPWGGEDGGFANGTAYGQYDVASLMLPFDIISQATGVDLYRKAWLRNVPRFFVYFLPPGAPAAPFGDAAEIQRAGSVAWTMRALSQRVPEPLIRWAAAMRPDAGRAPMSLMLAAQSEPLAMAPFPSVPNAIVLHDIGWAAMHSDLADLQRTSVYFKSSPYGSHNHSHADQNAFVVHSGGVPLLVSSGYYDFYGSQHVKDWYWTTRAHNAITFDGGRGQPTKRLDAAGRIVAEAHAADHDVVVGDATQAYDGQLSQALRSLVYLRPGVVLVHDVLSSAQPRRWEWNFHALDRMQGDAHSVRIEHGGQSLCLDVLQGPDGRFEQTSSFGAEPQATGKGGDFAAQWHGAFVAVERSARTEYIVAMRVGCKGPLPQLQRDGTGWLVSVPGDGPARRVRLQPGQAQVTRAK